jgi:hypothetical protein
MQTLVCLEGAKATMEVVGQIAQEDQARKSFRRNSQKIDIVIKRMKKRVKTLEFEEPEYTEVTLRGGKVVTKSQFRLESVKLRYPYTLRISWVWS